MHGEVLKGAVKIRIDDSFVKRYVVDTHSNHLVEKILICYHSDSLYGEISKKSCDSFYWMPFLLGSQVYKRFSNSAGKEKQLVKRDVWED